METFDILIYAAIAAFLAYRLWSVLGQREEGEEEDRPPRPNPFARPPQGRPQQEADAAPAAEGAARVVGLHAAKHAPTSLAGALERVRALDPSFEEKKFLEGAKIAFSRIVAAFAAGDMAPVRRFLDGAVAASFDESIRQRAQASQALDNKIERFAAVDIVDARTQGNLSLLTVEFVTHQVNVLRATDGTVLEGDPRKAQEVRDAWVFRRDMKAVDPNWQVIETRS